MTPNKTHSVYRKWRNESSPNESEPKGLDMDVAGGGIDVDTTKTPSIALISRGKGQSREKNRVDVHLANSGGQFTQTWHYKEQIIRPSRSKTPWFSLDSLASFRLLSAPASVAYEKENIKMTTFFISYSGSTTAVWYIHSRDGLNWDSPTLIDGPDLHNVRSSFSLYRLINSFGA